MCVCIIKRLISKRQVPCPECALILKTHPRFLFRLLCSISCCWCYGRMKIIFGVFYFLIFFKFDKEKKNWPNKNVIEPAGMLIGFFSPPIDGFPTLDQYHNERLEINICVKYVAYNYRNIFILFWIDFLVKDLENVSVCAQLSFIPRMKSGDY